MSYEEQVLDYWSKIVSDQREFREKLLKAGNRTLFLCPADTDSELGVKSGLQKDCMRAGPGSLQSVGIISEKLLRRSH